MSITIAGKKIPTTDTGYLVNAEDWSEEVAAAIARREDLALTSEHMDIVRHLRDEYFNNNGNQPNTRNLVKAMSAKWGRPVAAKDLYALFPGDPSKQAGRIAGLPESRRKGGY